MRKSELKDHFETGDEFEHYKNDVRVGLVKCRADWQDFRDVVNLTDNISSSFVTVSKLLVELRQNPTRKDIDEKVKEERKNIEELVSLLNNNYLEILLKSSW